MTATKFFGFAIADSMFPSECKVTRTSLSIGQFVEHLKGGVVSCCNGSHEATVTALNTLLKEHEVSVEIPAAPPQVKLAVGDSVIVMSVRGLPRLTDNRHFTEEEISSATFVFGLWTCE